MPQYGSSSSSYANGQGSSHSYTSTPALNHGYGQPQQPQPQGYQGQYPQQQQPPVAYPGYPSTYGSGQDVPTPPIQTPSPNLTDTLASIPDEQRVRTNGGKCMDQFIFKIPFLGFDHTVATGVGNHQRCVEALTS